MFYTVYKVTNLVNGKIYVGCHQTTDLDDDYMGSGKMLKRAIAKYGIVNFKREHLAIFDNATQMFEMESQVVNDDFVRDPNTYNIKTGGNGGWDHLKRRRSKVHRNNISRAMRRMEIENPEYVARRKAAAAKAVGTIEVRAKMSASLSGGTLGFKGKRHSPKSISLMSKIAKEHARSVGSSNPNFGKCWIYHDVLKRSISVLACDVTKMEHQGWKRGRRMKF